MIPKEFQGKVFAQIAPRLRWCDGAKGEVESFRPISEITGQVIGDPPLISFDNEASWGGKPLDIARFIAQGRLKLVTDPAAKAAPPMTDIEAHAKPKLPTATDAPAENGGS